MVNFNNRPALDKAWKYLGASGLANKIKDAKSDFSMEYRKLPPRLFEQKYVQAAREGQHHEGSYYRFVQDMITLVISLVDDGANGSSSVNLNSKNFRMSPQSVQNFNRGWKVMEEMYNSNPI